MHLNICDSITITDKSLLTVTLYLIQTVDISSAHGYVFIRTLVLHDSPRRQTLCYKSMFICTQCCTQLVQTCYTTVIRSCFQNILLPHGSLHVCNTEDYKIHDNNNKSRK